MKRILTILMALMIVMAIDVPSWGQVLTEASIVFSEAGLTDGQDMNEQILAIDENVSVAFRTAAGNTAPQFHGSSNSIWAYGGNRIEINSPCPITNVVFTTGADDGDNVIGSDVGNMNSLTWTGSAYSVSFYFSNYSAGGDPDAHRSIAAIEVDYLVSENVPAPTFTPEPGSYFESVDVSIDCNSQNNNVTIYYTDDGSIPNSNSMIFSTTPSPASPQPIQITQTTTLKAIAVMEDASGMPIDSSSIATATYVIPEDLNEVSISEAKSYPAGEYAMVYGTVTLIQGQQLFIQDYSGGIRLNCTVEPDTSLFLGADVQVIGKVTEGLCMTELSEIDPYNSSQFSVLWDEPLPEEVHTISEIVSDFENGDNALQASRVMIKGARVESINFFAYTTISQDNETIDIFQLPMIEGLQVGDSISVAAIVSCYNSLELLVAKAEDVRPYTAPRLKTFSLLADIEDFDPNASYLLVCPSASTAAMRYDDSGLLATQVSIEEGSDYPYITTFTDEDDYPCTFTFEPDPASGYYFMKWDDLYLNNDGEEFIFMSDQPTSYWSISNEDGGCMVLTAPTPRFFGGYGGDGWFYYTQPYDSLYSVDYPFTVLYKEGTPAPQQVSTPTFDPVSGNYITPQQVSIFCATDDATIYYTLDGSEPNENSLVYVDPIEVSQQNTNTIIKAIAMKDGWTASEVATSEYFILAPISIADAKALQPGAKVMVEGVVTYFDDYTIYIQDETAGIVINLDQQFPGIAIGDLFQVYATREYVGGMYALIDIDKYNIVSHNNELPLVVRTIAECLEGADYELQSTRVQIVDAILGSLDTGGITMLYQDTDSIGIFKIPAVGPEYNYSFVNVIGVLSYGDAAQLLVAFDSDIERLESSMNVSPENLEDFSYEQGEGPSEPQSIMITYEYVPYDVYLSTSETFEMSLSEDGPYSPSLELPKSDGGLSEYIVYVRMVAALPMDTYQSSLSISYGYDEIIIPLVGNVEILNTVEDPTFSPAGGTFMNGQMVSITCATPDATIYYTTDGSRVTLNSPVYSEPIEVDSSMVISAMAVRENWWNSNVVTAEYEILTPMSIAEAKSLQPGSLAMVEGVVTFIDGILVFIQDESAGIALNLTEAYSNLAVGDLVQVYGIRNNSQGLIKLVGINPTESNRFNIVSSDNDLPLEVRTIEECLNGAGDELQSTRVMIEEAVIGTINTNGNTSLTQGNNTINIYKVPALDNVESNSYVNIIAVIGNNINNTPQLHVAFASDVEPIESSLTIEPESLSGFTYEQGEGPSDPQVFSVSCEYIAGNVVLTAGEFFEMSLTEDGQYSSTLSLPTVDGMLSATTVYVRMMADLEENDYESSITVPLNGDEISVSLSGTVTWTQVVATPMFSPAGGIYMNAPMVSMICSTPGATIYYTLDGSEPTENSILYSDPIEVNSSCVIKAIAVLTGWKNSEVKTDSYEILTPMSIAEAKALQLNEFAMVEGVVTFIDDRNVYVQDETAGIVLYLNKAASNLAVGDQVQAYGKRATANGLIELTGINPADYTRFNIVSSGNELPLAVMTIEECLEGAADELQSTRVLIENAVIGVIHPNGNTSLTQGESSMNIYKIPALEGIEANDHVNVIAVIGYYNNPRLRVAFATDVEVAVPNLTVTPQSLQGFTYEQGEGPSEPQTLTLSGQSLAESILLTIDQYFEMSLTADGQYASTLSLPTEDGALAGTTVYVRMMADLTMNDYESVITVANGDEAITVNLSGNVTISNTVEAPVFTPAGGSFLHAQTVSILCPTDGAAIHYTLDGSEPTESSTVYTEPFEVSSSALIRAIATKPNWMDSEEASDYYEILIPMTIAEAKELEMGEHVTIEGIVTFIDGNNVTIQDETAGIVLNLGDASVNTAIGDKVITYGQTVNVNGLFKLFVMDADDDNQFDIVSNDNELPLEVQSIENCLAGADYELQSTRVMIEEAIIGTINPDGYTTLTQGGNTINIYHVPALDNVEPNSYVNVIAVIGYDNEAQLRVYAASDVTMLAPSLTVNPQTLELFSYEQGEGPSETQTLMVNSYYVAGDVVLTAGEYFEISLTEDGPYSSMLSLPTEEGRLEDAPVYVRMMADLMMNEYESTLILTYGNEEMTLALNGNVTISNTVEAPAFIPAAGNYMSTQLVSILCPTEGATIYYTTDGSEPNENSTVYSEPIEVSSITVIKAIATKLNWMNSEVVTASYEIFQTMTIAEAKVLEIGEYAMVEGVVTFIDGNDVTIQDPTAGIVLNLNNNGKSLVIGDKVQAIGQRATTNGLIKLVGIDANDANQFNIVSNDNELPLAVMTVEECLAGADNQLQSTRVMIQGAYIGEIDNAGNTVLTQGGNAINIYQIPVLENFDGNAFVNVIAVIGYNNEPQLRMANASDLEAVEPELAVTPMSLQGFTYEQGEGPSEPQTITVSGQYLMDNVLLTAEQYFEMSLTADGQYASTLSLPTEDGALAGTTVYVRMMADLTMNDYESVITVANGDEAITVNLSGNVTISNTVEAPVFTPAGGSFLHAQTVSILCPTDGAAIHYTLDGSEPTESSTVYTEPFEVSSSALIRAIATKPNWMDSEEASDYYEILIPMTIAEAKELEMGEHVTIEGIVTFIDGNNVTIQDETAGIVLNLGDASVNTAIGDKVITYGQTVNVNGLFKLFVMDADDDNQFDIVSNDNELPLEVQSIENCLAGADYELQSTRVMIEEAIIGTINPDGYTTLTQGGNTINIYHVPALDNVEPNSYVNVIAVIGYDNEAQLRVYAASDVTMLAPSLTVNPQTLELFSYEQGEGPSETQTLMVNSYYVAGDVVLTAGEYFEISLTEDGPYSSMLSLPTEEGRLEDAPVYVRMMADLMMNEYESTLILTYGNEEMTLALNGNVTISNTVEAPAFIPAAGNYMSTQLVSILCPTEGATIYYTTDGSEPNENSTVYSEPIEVSSITVIKAIATKLNWMNSEVVTASYEISQTMTIAEAKALEINEYATVEGVVTFIEGKNVYIQDATAGINLYLSSNASNVAIGDMVRAYGKRATFNGLIELSGINPNDDSQFSIVSNDNPLPLVVKTIEECLAGGAYELQSTRVMIQNAVIGTINTNGNTTLTQGDNTINIYRIPALEDVEANSFVNVIAVIGYYNAPQLRVAFASDVEVLEPNLTVTPLSLQGFTYEQSQGPSATQTITVSGQHLAENVVLTADQYFEMSLSANGVYHSTLNLTTEDGTLNATTVYVRMMAGLVMGNYESSITVANGDEEILVNLSGIVTISNMVEAPSFNPAGGSYLSAQLVSILCPTEGATIHYTMDGSNPTENSPVYTEPIEVNSTCVIKAIATKANWMSSSIVTASYEIYSTMTIAEARQLANNQYATVQGVVTLVDGRNVYIQDNTAGIVLYLNNNTVPSDLSIGDMVRSHGKKSVYNGLVELTGIKGNNTNEFMIVSEDNTLPLNNLTINQIQSDYDADNLLQATRIKINNAIIRSINYNGNSLITQGDAQINIYKMPYVEGLEVGDNVTVTGVIGCFNAPQILVAQSTDITFTHRPTIVASPNSMPTLDYVVGEGPSQVQTLMVSGTRLTGYIQITASENFEISDTDGEYFLPTSSMLLAPVGDELAPTPVYVRLKAGLPLGMYNESLVLSSEGADEVYVSCTGNVHEEGDQNGWRKINDLSEIVEGSRIIIAARYDNENTNSYYAMTASTSGKPTGVLFTSEMSGADEVLPATITNEAGTYAWTIGRLGELYTFTNEAGSVLGYSSSTNFATGGDNIGWSIVSGTSIDTGVMVSNYAAFNIINGNVTNRAAALNSNHNFGPYSTSNMTNGNGANYNFYLDIFISSSSATPTVSAPVFAPVAGTYYEEIDVTIECATEDATIYYSDSSEDGPWTVYTTPIHLVSSTTLWAYAEKEDYNTSAVVSAEYIINAGMVILFDQDWEEDWKGWTEVSVIGEPQWGINSHSGNHYAYANAYNQGQTEDWLISPAFDLDAHPDAILNFRTARNYSGPDIEVFFSNDYDGEHPAEATWQPIVCELSQGNGWNWVETGDISMSGFSGSNCYIAYRYTSTEDLAAGWEVDDILLYCNGTSENPYLNATPNALSGFTHLEGQGPSASQSFVLTGGNLPPVPGSDEGAVLVYFANNFDFEISLDDQEYSSSLYIPVVGTLDPTTIYVRLNGTEIGHYETDLTIEGSGDVSITVALSGDVLSADQPGLDAFMPVYIQGNNGSNNNRVPIAIAVYLANLEPNTTYRYVNQFVDDNDGPETPGAGNVIYANPNGFYRTTSPSLATEGDYGEFTTDENGDAFAWFINEPTANTRFTPGNHVYLRIRLNDGQRGTDVAHILTTEDFATVLNFGTGNSDTEGTAFYASSEEDPMTFVMMFSDDYDFRPTYSTTVETTGIDYASINQYADFYKEEVAGKDGYFGGIIPNNNEKGINIIWVLDMESYVIGEYYTENGDGIWGEVTTANLTGGIENPVYLDLISLSVEEGEALNVKVWNREHEIIVENAEAQGMKMMVYNLHGQPVMTRNIAAQSNVRIPHNLSYGLYVITLENAQGKMSAKIVVR